MRFGIHVEPVSFDHETTQWEWRLTLNPSSNRPTYDRDDISGGYSARSVPDQYRKLSKGTCDSKRAAIAFAKTAAKEIERRMAFDEKLQAIVERDGVDFVYETKPARAAVS